MHADRNKATKAYVQSESPMPAGFTPDEQACLQSLYFTEANWRRNAIADPAPATCVWLLNHPRYHEWLDQGHGLLWIKGKPGSGKSTVLKHVLENAEREPKQNLILASFFFHGRGAPIQRSVLGLFRSLLHQILQLDRVLLSDFTSLYNNKSESEGQYGIKWTWNENQLQGFFKSIVVHTARTHKMRIYIDALDECGQDTALDLVEFFRCFAGPISICFSCRHYPFVALEGGDEVRVEDENKQDINFYVRNLLEAHIQSAAVAEAIRDEVVSRSRGNFQWVVLVMLRVLKLYKSRKSVVTILRMIRRIPAKLSELYTEILEGIEGHERAQSLHFMQWICFAFRPLTLTELRFALAVTADTSYKSIQQCQRSESYVETDEDMELRICDLSAGLAEVLESNGTSIVQFIHQSVKDFLLEKGLRILDKPFAGAVAGGGHFWISRSCIKLFHMEEVQIFALSLDHMNISKSDKVKNQDYFTLLDYSVRFWPLHAAEVEGANIPQDDLAALTSETPDNMLHSWFAIYQILQTWVYEHKYSTGETLLYVASKYNLISVVKAVLAQNVWADQPNRISRTPLSVAARRGHEDVVKLLVNRHDVDVNHKDSHGNTPLFLATTGRHKAVIETLINREDTDLNSKDCRGDTPLSEAAQRGHDAIVRILLERGVDLDSKNSQQQTPLYQAASLRHYEVVKLLLQHNADTDARDSFNRTPLSQAASMGHCEVVELLLQHNADIDARDNSYQTPLLLAASNGHHEVVELLLQRNGNVNSIDMLGRTPLSYASNRGHKETVKLFVERSDVDVNFPGWTGRSPLSWALAPFSRLSYHERHMAVVDLLLSRHDISVSEKDEATLRLYGWEGKLRR